jgi:hypothetical protein
VAGSDVCNRDSAALFYLSRRPFPLWMARVWWFGVVWRCMARVGHTKNHKSPSIYFSSFNSVFLLLFAIVLFILIISNWILFSISSLFILFF